MIAFFVILWIELKIYFRSPLALFWTFLFPFLLLSIFMEFKVKAPGQVKIVSVNVIDLDKSDNSSRYIDYIKSRITATEIISIKLSEESEGELVRNADINLTINEGFSKFIHIKVEQEVIVEYGQYSPWQVHAAAGIMESASDSYYLSELGLTNSINVIKRENVKSYSSNEKELTAQQFLVSGLLAMVIFSNSLLGFSGLIVQRRSANNYRMQMISPLKITLYMTSYALSRIIILSIFSFVFIFISDHLYNLNIHYSVTSVIGFMATVLLGALCFFMIGLALVTRIRSVNTATGINNMIYFPLLFSSNIFFPLVTDSNLIKETIDFFPLINFVELLRGCLFYNYSLSENIALIMNMVLWLLMGIIVTKYFFHWHFSD